MSLNEICFLWEEKIFFLPCFQKTSFLGSLELGVDSLANNKISDLPKLKGFADDKINVTKKLKFVLGRVEKNVVKGENPGYQHFLLFTTMFSKVILY